MSLMKNVVNLAQRIELFLGQHLLQSTELPVASLS